MSVFVGVEDREPAPVFQAIGAVHPADCVEVAVPAVPEQHVALAPVEAVYAEIEKLAVGTV